MSQLATEYIRQQLDQLPRKKLTDQLLELMQENKDLKRRVGLLEEADTEPWYVTGHPVPYTPADGQW